MATLLYKEAKTSVESLSANLFEVVLLEISDISEKFDVGSRFQVPLVSFRPVGNRCALLVKNEYGKIKSGSKCGVAGLVDEYGQLPHETPFKIKMSGGNPPDARRSLYSRKPLSLYHAEHSRSRYGHNKQDIATRNGSPRGSFCLLLALRGGEKAAFVLYPKDSGQSAAIGRRSQRLAHLLATEFFQPVLFEGIFTSEKTELACSLLVVLVSNCGQFNSAYVVRNLKQPVIAGCGVFVNDCVCGNRLLNCGVNDIVYYFLAVVVVDFYVVVFLHKSKIALKEAIQLFSHLVSQRGPVSIVALSKSERRVPYGAFFGKDAKLRKRLLSFAHGIGHELIVSSQHGREMEGCVWKFGVKKRSLEAGYSFQNVVALVMKDECQQIKTGPGAGIAGLVDEYGQLTHVRPPLIKMPGGTPRLLDSLPLRNAIDFIPQARALFQGMIITNKRSISKS